MRPILFLILRVSPHTWYPAMLCMTGFPVLANSPSAFDIHQQWGSQLAYNPVKAGFVFAFCILV